MTLNPVTRIILFLLVAVAVFNGVWWLAIPLALIVLVYTDAFEYIILAWIIDVYYSPVALTFWYTATTVIVVMVLSWIRPYLRWRPSEAE